MKKLLALILAATLSSCEYQPKISSENVDAGQYAADLKECRKNEDRYDNQANSLRGIFLTSSEGIGGGAAIGYGVQKTVLTTAVGAGVGGLVGTVDGEILPGTNPRGHLARVPYKIWL